MIYVNKLNRHMLWFIHNAKEHAHQYWPVWGQDPVFQGAWLLEGERRHVLIYSIRGNSVSTKTHQASQTRWHFSPALKDHLDFICNICLFFPDSIRNVFIAENRKMQKTITDIYSYYHVWNTVLNPIYGKISFNPPATPKDGYDYLYMSKTRKGSIKD